MVENGWRVIEETFEQRFGVRGVRAELSRAIPHQAQLTLFLSAEPTPEMAALARAIEAEYAEPDRVVWIQFAHA